MSDGQVDRRTDRTRVQEVQALGCEPAWAPGAGGGSCWPGLLLGLSGHRHPGLALCLLAAHVGCGAVGRRRALDHHRVEAGRLKVGGGGWLAWAEHPLPQPWPRPDLAGRSREPPHSTPEPPIPVLPLGETFHQSSWFLGSEAGWWPWEPWASGRHATCPGLDAALRFPRTR